MWETLEADQASLEAGLPNRTCPSDHYPIGCRFAVRPVPRLPDPAKEALGLRWAARAAVAAEAVAALDSELGAEEAIISARVQAAAAAVTASEPAAQTAPPAAKKAKKQKKARAKPAPELVGFLRSKRTRIKALKAKQAAELADAVAALSDLELDVLEEMGLQ